MKGMATVLSIATVLVGTMNRRWDGADFAWRGCVLCGTGLYSEKQ